MNSILSLKDLPNVGFNSADFSSSFNPPIYAIEDFLQFRLSDWSVAASDNFPWRIGGTNTVAATCIKPLSTTFAPGGWISVEHAGADGDETYAQMVGTPLPFASARPCAFQFGFKLGVAQAANMEYFMGFCPDATITAATTSTDPIGTQPTGIGFAILAGVLHYTVKTSAVTIANTSTGITLVGHATITLAPKYKLTAIWDGIQTLTLYLGNRELVKLTLAAFTAQNLSPVFGSSATGGAVAAQKLFLDYILMAAPPEAAGR